MAKTNNKFPDANRAYRSKNKVESFTMTRVEPVIVGSEDDPYMVIVGSEDDSYMAVVAQIGPMSDADILSHLQRMRGASIDIEMNEIFSTQI